MNPRAFGAMSPIMDGQQLEQGDAAGGTLVVKASDHSLDDPLAERFIQCTRDVVNSDTGRASTRGL
jgi:hypothetical protein